MRLDIDEIAHRDLARRWAAGRDADPAIAHHHCGDAVPGRRGDRRIPADLRVIVRYADRDKPRGDDTIGGIDNALRAIGDPADFGDSLRREGHIGAPRRRPAAVDDGPVLAQAFSIERPSVPAFVILGRVDPSRSTVAPQGGGSRRWHVASRSNPDPHCRLVTMARSSRPFAREWNWGP